MSDITAVADQTMTDFRLLFGGVTVLLFGLLVVTLLTRSNRNPLSFSTNLTSSLLLLVVSILAMITENRILTLTNLEGDRFTFYLFLASIFLGIANPMLYKLIHKRSRSRRYRF